MKFLILNRRIRSILFGSVVFYPLSTTALTSSFIAPRHSFSLLSPSTTFVSHSSDQSSQQRGASRGASRWSCRRASRWASSTSLGVSIGIGPESSDDATATDESSDTLPVIVGEDGEPLPYITDHEPYRQSRMSQSDRNADAWFGSLLGVDVHGADDDDDNNKDVDEGEREGGLFLGKVSREAKERLLKKVDLVDEPKLEYGQDEWTPYVTRRLPTSPLYPAYGLETFGLPIPRRNAEAWRHFDVNGLIATDYSNAPDDVGQDMTLTTEQTSNLITNLQSKGAWLDDSSCSGRLVYVNGRFCPTLSKQTSLIKNLDANYFVSPDDKISSLLSRLPDGFTDELAALVPDESKDEPLSSLKKLSGPDHCVGEPTSQFAINNQQGSAAFAALNSVKAGCVAYVESSLSSMSSEVLPTLVVHVQTPSGGDNRPEKEEKGVSIHPRTLAVANNGSQLSLIQMSVDFDSPEESPHPTFVNSYTQIFVGEKSNVTHSYLDESGGIVTPRVELTTQELDQLGSSSANPREIESQRPALRNTRFETIDVHVTGDEGAYSSSIMEIGGTGRSRISLSASLLRPKAMAAVNGFALSGGAQRCDMRTNIHHIAQGTISRQQQRNMVGGRSTASFRGRIRVEQSAQQTDSEQLSRTILLSDHARIWAIPSLEIIADDVTCTHGATVSDLSEEELFYLRSRGLDRKTARNVLMYAFVDEIGRCVDPAIMGDYDDEVGLRKRVTKRLENLVPLGEKTLMGGEFQSV